MKFVISKRENGEIFVDVQTKDESNKEFDAEFLEEDAKVQHRINCEGDVANLIESLCEFQNNFEEITVGLILEQTILAAYQLGAGLTPTSEYISIEFA